MTEHRSHWIWKHVPLVLPPLWRIAAEDAIDGRKWRRPMGASQHGWTVIMSGDTEQDGKRWIHLSTAMTHRLPNWEELTEVRDIFLGRDKRAIQVLAPAEDHININANCLHLWHCIDGDPVPDFARGGNTI